MLKTHGSPRAMFTLLVALAAAAVAMTVPNDARAQVAATESASPATAVGGDIYALPESNETQAILAVIERLSQTPAPDKTPAGIRAHFNKLEQIADVVMGRKIEPDGFVEALRLKIGALTILEQLGDTNATKRKQEFVAKLKQDPRPSISVHGRILEIEAQVAQLQPKDDATAQMIVDNTMKVLQEKPLTDGHVSLAYNVASQVEMLADEKIASTAYQAFAKYLKTSDDNGHVELAKTFEGAARRLSLIGNPVQITGKNIDGQPFDLEQLKGKVILVDFWATWCGPCMEELPKLKALYNKHHEAGFEVVGINLDDNPGRVGAMLATNGIKWPNLVSDAGQDHPIANYYGVYQLPTTFLIGRDGKVVDVDLFGDELGEEVARLLAAASASPE